MSKRLATIGLFLVVVMPSARVEARVSADELAMKMIEAHGGMERWEKSTIVHFEQRMEAPNQPVPWVSSETIEQGDRRVFQDWPLDEAVIVFDGRETWSVNWHRANPPKFMVHLTYYFLCLPWLTQDPGVQLSYEGMKRFPTAEKDYHALRMTFDAGVGDSPDDYYVIYIDPETFRMRGTEFIVTYGPMLDLFRVPPEVTFIGPLFKVYEEYSEVEGLLMPTRYKTRTPDGTVYGDHWVSDYEFSGAFDESRLVKPDEAVVDLSSNVRKTEGR